MLTPNTKPETQEYFYQAIEVIKKQGYIRSTELLKIFKGMNTYAIMLCFDRNGEGLFEDYMIIKNIDKYGAKKGKMKVKIYRRLKPVFDEWREDTKHLVKNGCMGSVGINI